MIEKANFPVNKLNEKIYFYKIMEFIDKPLISITMTEENISNRKI